MLRFPIEPPCSETKPEPEPTRDVEYFLEPIFILVEDTMFQIPKHYMSQIDIFSTAFSLPPSKEGAEGFSEKCPLKLLLISKKDFKAFLKVLIPLQIPCNYSNIKMDEWISTLNLSSMWELTTFRDLAIRHLGYQIDAIEMIVLGSKYRVSQWFISGCTKLIGRAQGPTEEEGNLLGMRFTVQIYGIRERLIIFRATRPTLPFDFQGAVRDAFPNEIYD